jgi:hypothetical protein
MAKGFLRRIQAPLAGAILLAGLPWSTPVAGGGPGKADARGTPWWEVRLNVTAEGKYVLRGDGPPVTGFYALEACWEGRLDPDAEDFILVQIKTELLGWRLREGAGPAGRETVLEAPDSPSPALHLIYVLKDGHEVEFAFELGEIAVPLRPSSLTVPLELPRSSGRAYRDFVCRGSNRVVIPESDLEERSPERRFAWEWRSEEQILRKGRAFFVEQGHTVKATVALIRH